MDSLTREKISILRKRTPIGLSDGLRLLARTDGDIEQAEFLFLKEQAVVIAEKTGISTADAEIHLVNNGLDLHKTLKAVYEALYPLSESIIRYYEDNKEVALFNIAGVSLNAQPDIQQLPPAQYCLVVIASWLRYVADEPWEFALSDELPIVINQIEKVQQTTLAACLRAAAPYAASVRNNLATPGASSLREDAMLDHYKQQFLKLRPALINSLYDYVCQNLSLFPQEHKQQDA